MSEPPSKSPSYQNGFMPTPHQIYQAPPPPPPPIPYYQQPHQYGMYVPVANPYEGGTENSGWYLQQFNPNYQPYYQPDPGAPLPPPDYHINCNYSPNYYDQSMRDTSPPRESFHWILPPVFFLPRLTLCDGYTGPGNYSPIYWQSPSSEYMAVPHNSPVHTPLDPVSQSYLLSGSPGFRKPATLPKPKRHRAPTFPGADPPNLTFFEGSKKSDWSTYSSDTDLSPQGSEDQKSGSPKQDNRTPTATFKLNDNIHVSRGNCADTGYGILGGPYVSQDVVNFHALANHQSQHQDIHQRENQYPHYNKEHSPSRTRAQFSDKPRKPHFARPTMITPAIPNITWVEREGNQSGNINANRTFGRYPNPPSSVDSASLSPASTSARAARPSSPLIVTSICKSNCSDPPPWAADEPLPSRFTFNPKAEDFVLVPEIDSIQLPEVDEYVGFYLNPQPKPSHPPKTPAALPTYDCDPMAWQVPDVLTSPNAQSLESYLLKKSPEEFIGDIPKNMNWEKTFLPVDKKKARAKSWASMDSDDRMDTITEGEVPTILDEHQQVADVFLDVAENLNENINIETPHNTGIDICIRSNTSELLFSEPTAEAEVAQTVADDTNFFDHELHSVVKFPKCSHMHLSQGPKMSVEPCVEQVAAHGFDDARGLDEKELFGSDSQHVKLPNCKQAGVKSPDCTKVSVSGEISQEYAHKVGPKAKSKKAKSKAKSRVKAKPEPQKAILVAVPKPETKPETRPETRPVTKPDHSDVEVEVEVEGEKPCQKPRPHAENKTELTEPLPPCETEIPTGEATPAENHLSLFKKNTEFKPEENPHPKEQSNPSRTPSTPIKDTKLFKVLNYRDALLTKVTNPGILIDPPPKISHPKGSSQKVVVVPNVAGKPTPERLEIILPPAQIGGRRKFFLSPLPTTATYDSVIRQLKGGMLEDIYISGLSPHPSAWKGPRGKYNSSQDFLHDNSWHAHVSFYSEEGASKFWELVQSSREYAGPYQSRYGGFDDQPPGFFYLDGMRVLVNWRHNDQRVVNSLTAKAVMEEKATRCLLLTFNVEATMKSRHMTPFINSIKEAEKRKELAFLKKVAADIENWGQADSNLQGIRLFNDLLENSLISKKVAASNHLAIDNTIQSNPKEVKILVSFIKLLTAVKMKRYLSSRQCYGNDGVCIVEYHKDECDESIDTLQAIREVDDRVAKQQFNHTKETTWESSAERKRPFARTESMGIEGKATAVKVEKWKAEGTLVKAKAAEVNEEGFVLKGKGKIRGGNGKKSHPV